MSGGGTATCGVAKKAAVAVKGVLLLRSSPVIQLANYVMNNLRRRCITTRRGEIITSMIPPRHMGSVRHVIGRR